MPLRRRGRPAGKRERATFVLDRRGEGDDGCVRGRSGDTVLGRSDSGDGGYGIGMHGVDPVMDACTVELIERRDEVSQLKEVGSVMNYQTYRSCAT